MAAGMVLLALPAVRAATPDDHRFVQVFIEDAAVVENAWVEGQLRFQNLDGDADMFRIGPVLAFSPIDNLEVGGRLEIIDADIGPSSENGLGDTTVYAKWQFFHNPVQFTVGVELFLPTGDEEKLLGTGEVDAAVFVAVRKNLDDAYVTGFFGIRDNSDSTIGKDVFATPVRLMGETSTFLGGAIMFPLRDPFAVSLELQVETERYESTDAIVEGTAAGYWFINDKITLRGAIVIGFDDGAPDWETIFGAAWHF